jgi:hypothetical protein
MNYIFLFFVLLSSNLVHAEEVSFNQLIGNYSVESKGPVTVLGDGVSVRYDITLKANETIELVESVVQTLNNSETVLMKMECAGSVTLDNEQNLISNVKCTNGEEFIQRINLSQIEDISAANFSAPVYSSLYGMTVEMLFKRI